MAKLGYEVEGKYVGLGLRTYFCSAEEFLESEIRNVDGVFDLLSKYEVDHIYISDHLNILDLDALSYVFEEADVIVTVELTQLTELPPERIEIFWNASQASYAQASTIKFLRPNDQIKIENEKTVFSWLVGDAIVTLPEDFNGDITV